jgi:hypothetical protein
MDSRIWTVRCSLSGLPAHHALESSLLLVVTRGLRHGHERSRLLRATPVGGSHEGLCCGPPSTGFILLDQSIDEEAQIRLALLSCQNYPFRGPIRGRARPKVPAQGGSACDVEVEIIVTPAETSTMAELKMDTSMIGREQTLQVAAIRRKRRSFGRDLIDLCS